MDISSKYIALSGHLLSLTPRYGRVERREEGGGRIKFIDEIRNEPVLLAHHPLCGRFDDHLLTIGGRKVCRGCATVYPSAIAVSLLLFIFRPDFLAAFAGSLMLFGAQLVRFAIPGHGVSVQLNITLGASLGMVFYSAVVCPPDLRFVVYPFIISVTVAFGFLKGRRMLRSCRDCPDRALYPACARGPGNIGGRK